MIIVWIIALILTVPTFGISLLVAFGLHLYMNNQNRHNERQIVNIGVTLFSMETVNKYHNFQQRHNLPSTQMYDEEIANEVVSMMVHIESYLSKNGRFENNKGLVQDVAIRFTSIKELFEQKYVEEIFEQELTEIAQFGLLYIRNKPYPRFTLE